MRVLIVRRLQLVPPMLLAISILSFLPVGLSPDSGIDYIMSNLTGGPGFDFRAAEIDLRHHLGLDQPISLHYLRWMGIVKQPDGKFRGVLEGDLGQSLFGPHE